MASLADIAPLSDRDFERVREMAHEACGLSLHQGKRALVSSRLARLVRREGFDSFSGYVNLLSQRRNGDEFIDFIDALTTNYSGFWREPEHFEFLRKIMLATRCGRLRVWSAACATGEEPYTIAMCALEAGAENCRIEASDISRNALNAALRGVYDAAGLWGLPLAWRQRYFTTEATAGALRVTAPVRALVHFRSVNLLQPFQHLGIFDAILCRNVMIYFDRQTRQDLVERLAGQLAPGGHLLTGHSETLLCLPAGLRYVQPAVYRKC